jgi:hypothetical protein
MLFGTKVEWAESNPLLRAVTAPYYIVDTFEIMSFSIFYILEIQFEEEENVLLGRLFIIEGLERVFEILNDPKTRKHRLSIFVPGGYNQSGSSSIHRVKKIYHGLKEENWRVHIFKCTDRIVSDDEGYKKLSDGDLICVYPFSIRRKGKIVSDQNRKCK